ncbi:hypothetical protein [Larkinella arboricola]|uniref:hypothetical protein n=1 Tax=Larkinella arboricola TaxID=643671 RepID=UPI0011BA8C73|nr:hypothetical protein [Larkinella arboricola]
MEESLEEIAPILLFGRTLLFASLKKSNDVLKILPIDVVENESVADYLQRLQREWIAYVESNV